MFSHLMVKKEDDSDRHKNTQQARRRSEWEREASLLSVVVWVM